MPLSTPARSSCRRFSYLTHLCGCCFDSTRRSFPTCGPGAMLHSPWPLPYLLADRYRMVQGLGKGGMGAVIAADDERLDREVAIKVDNPEYFNRKRVRARFKQEAQAIASIQDPGVGDAAVHVARAGDGPRPRLPLRHLLLRCRGLPCSGGVPHQSAQELRQDPRRRGPDALAVDLVPPLADAPAGGQGPTAVICWSTTSTVSAAVFPRRAASVSPTPSKPRAPLFEVGSTRGLRSEQPDPKSLVKRGRGSRCVPPRATVTAVSTPRRFGATSLEVSENSTLSELGQSSLNRIQARMSLSTMMIFCRGSSGSCHRKLSVSSSTSESTGGVSRGKPSPRCVMTLSMRRSRCSENIKSFTSGAAPTRSTVPGRGGVRPTSITSESVCSTRISPESTPIASRQATAMTSGAP